MYTCVNRFAIVSIYVRHVSMDSESSLTTIDCEEEVLDMMHPCGFLFIVALILSVFQVG